MSALGDPTPEHVPPSGTTANPGDRGGPRLEPLDRSECLELLAATTLGRVVLSAGPHKTPVIRPVNYSFDGASQSVVFRTGYGSKFHALVRATAAAFEIDSIDPDSGSGWSVIISGVTEHVRSPGEIQRLDQLGLRSLAPGEKPHWIRIRARTVSGRRISAGHQPQPDAS